MKKMCSYYYHILSCRDAFYELLREWESNHHNPGWTMSGKMGDRIRALVSYKTELANHLHFARLFQSQLISVRCFLYLYCVLIET